MKKIVPLAAVLLLGLLSAPADAEPPTRSKTIASLVTLFSDTDYPEEAIANEEQGAVTFRLDVGTDGRVGSCSIESSSGSTALDVTTCRILMDRARFQPARDATGKPTSDTHTGRITWRLPDDEMPARTKTAFELWTSCVVGEAAKLVPGDLPPDQAAARSFTPCTALEALVAAQTKLAAPLTDMRKSLATTIEARVKSARTALQAPPDAAETSKR